MIPAHPPFLNRVPINEFSFNPTVWKSNLFPSYGLNTFMKMFAFESIKNRYLNIIFVFKRPTLMILCELHFYTQNVFVKLY